MPFDMLTVLSKAEGLTAPSKAEGLRCVAPFVIAAYCTVSGLNEKFPSLYLTLTTEGG